jgi:SnoaL-like domain
MDPAPEQRLALLAVDHPLNYTKIFTEAKPQTVEEKVGYLYERRQVEDLLNTYGYVLDTCMVRPEAADAWVDLFTDDCELTYPFGTHRTKNGLAEWCLAAETRFKRMAVCTGLRCNYSSTPLTTACSTCPPTSPSNSNLTQLHMAARP